MEGSDLFKAVKIQGYKEDIKFKKFIDFDKNKKIFYNNMYLNEYKIVVKIPFVNKELSQEVKKIIKIEKFDLTKNTFLLSY